jgi:hypothetical protein
MNNDSVVQNRRLIPQVTRPQIIARLEENEIPFLELKTGNDTSILVSQHGGRIFGPFLSPESESLYWVNPAFHDQDACKELIQSGWNQGGERYWIAPEIQFMVRDRFKADDTWFVPPEMDPGNWLLRKVEHGGSSTGCRLEQEITLWAHNLASGVKKLRLEVKISKALDPLRHLDDYSSLLTDLIFAGYEQVVTLTETEHDQILSGVWNLIQVNAAGFMVIPGTLRIKPTLYKGEYIPSNDDDQANQPPLVAIYPNHARLWITGQQMYKVGFKAANVFGRIGYLGSLPVMGDEQPGNLPLGSQAYLLVRSFSHHPSSVYPEEPPEFPGRHGDSIHVYNHSGVSDGIPNEIPAAKNSFKFGEIECAGRTIGGETGISTATDTFSLYIYAGVVEKLEIIAQHLLGIDWK